MMDCADSRAALWPPERPRLAKGEVFAAREHVEGCTSCQEYFQQDEVILHAYTRLRAQSAPRGLRERVFDALARERAQTMGIPVGTTEGTTVGSTGVTPATSSGELTPRVPITSRSLMAAAVVVMAASAGAFMLGRPAATEVANAPFVEDYLRRAVGQDRLDTHDAAEVVRFVMRELGVMITPAQFAGIELSAVEVCLLDGRRGVMIKYVVDGREISHYVVPNEGSERRAPALSEYEDQSEPNGPSVITWSSGMVEQALVGDLGVEELLTLARQMPDDE